MDSHGVCGASFSASSRINFVERPVTVLNSHKHTHTHTHTQAHTHTHSEIKAMEIQTPHDRAMLTGLLLKKFPSKRLPPGWKYTPTPAINHHTHTHTHAYWTHEK
jgi:hypothetical protein